MDEKKETIETYNKSATVLAKRFNKIGARTKDIKKTFSYINKKNANVIEIGCGNGRDAKEIFKYTSNYLGIDISKEMIKIAKESVPKGKFKVADLENFDFPKNIDIVFSFASLLHSNEHKVKSVLGKIYFSLNKEGIFYISLMSLKLDGCKKETKVDEFGTRTFYYYTPKKIKELAGNKFKTIYEDRQVLQKQKWFTIILQKS